MSLIQFSNYGTTPFERLLGHAPEILNQLGKLELTFFSGQNFST